MKNECHKLYKHVDCGIWTILNIKMFIAGISCLQRNMLLTMHALDAIEPQHQMIRYNLYEESLLEKMLRMPLYRLTKPCHYFGCFEHEMWQRIFFFEVATFLPKEPPHENLRNKMTSTTFEIRSKRTLLLIVCSYDVESKAQPPNGCDWKSQDREKYL